MRNKLTSMSALFMRILSVGLGFLLLQESVFVPVDEAVCIDEVDFVT